MRNKIISPWRDSGCELEPDFIFQNRSRHARTVVRNVAPLEKKTFTTPRITLLLILHPIREHVGFGRRKRDNEFE